MITIILKHHNKHTEVDMPAMYEELQLALWKLGLDREPEKYTLLDLGATFHYQSPLEYFVLRLLEGEMKLLDAVAAIYSVTAPPRPIMAQVQILSSGFKSITELRREVDRLIESTAQFGSSCYFPTRTLYMNIFAGQSGTKRPTVVYIYGGGWFYGDHTNSRNRNVFCKNLMKLVTEGVVVAAVEYRRGIEAVFPAQLHDVKGAVRFLRANAEAYGIDPNRIAAMGESAGGHLTALLALTSNRPDLEGITGGNLNQSSSIQAAVDIFGPSDLLTYADQFDSTVLGEDKPMQMPVSGRSPEEWEVYGPDAMLVGYDGPGRGIRKLMEIAAAENPDHPDWKYVELIRQASPMTYVHENCAPMLILHGMRDIMVPVEQSWQLYYELCKVGADVWFMTRNFATHGPSLGAECDEAMLDFLRKRLRDKYENT